MLAFSIVIIVLVVIQLALCVYIGIKKGLLNALVSLAFNAVACFVSLMVGRLTTLFIQDKFVPIAMAILKKAIDSDESKNILNGGGVSAAISSFACIFAGFCVFIAMYLILYFIFKIPKHFIMLKLKERLGADALTKTPHKVIAACVTVLSGLISLIFILSPLAVITTNFDKAASKTDIYETSATASNAKKLVKNPILKFTAIAGGNSIINTLSNSEFENQDVNVSDEIYNISLLAFSSLDYLRSKELTKEEKTDILNQMDAAFSDSILLPGVVSDVASTVAEYLGDHRSPEGRSKEVYDELLSIIKDWDSESVKEDFSSIIDLTKLLTLNDLLDNVNDEKLIESFSDKKFTEELFTILFTNEDLKELIPHFAYAGIGSVCDELGITLPKDFTININLDDLTKEDIVKEADILSDIIGKLHEIKETNGTYNLEAMSINQLLDLSKVISELKDSYFLKSLVPQLLSQIVKHIDIKDITGSLLDDLKNINIEDIEDSLIQYYEQHEFNVDDIIK